METEDIKLAYVGEITEINAIEDASFIESADVFCGPGGAWKAVIRKGEFGVGDYVNVYLQDAILPEADFEFMRARGFRVRMARFMGVPSEVLVTKLAYGKNIGDDVTRESGVKKYSKPIPVTMGGKIKHNFPSFIPRTDEPNFQSVPHLIDGLSGKPYYVTIKADGSSGTAYRNGGELCVCSRNWEMKEEDGGVWWVVAKERNLFRIPDGFAVQFEVVAPGIQKNRLGVSRPDGLIFDVYNIRERDYLSPKEMIEFVSEYIPGTRTVTCIHMDDTPFSLDRNELSKLAEQNYESGARAEGIVIRNNGVPVYIGGDRLSFKVINLLYKD